MSYKTKVQERSITYSVKLSEDSIVFTYHSKPFYLSGCIFSKKIYLILCWNL